MNNKNKVNIFSVEEIIEVGEMFKEKGMNLKSIFTENTDLKFSKKKLDIHSFDTFIKENTTAFILIDNDKKFHRMWFKLVGYKVNDFENWKLESESIEYK